MAAWQPQRRDVLDALADEILMHYGSGRAIVAVDGPEGAGMRQFADGLVEALRRTGHDAFAASIDDFLRPRAERTWQGEDSPVGRYEDAYDYSALRRVLVDPFRMGGSTGFVLAHFDAARDAQREPKWTTSDEDAVLVIAGVFLQRRELRGLWNYVVRLDVPPGEAWSRLEPALRDAPGAAERALGAQELYAAEIDPSGAANAIVDNTDPEHPRRVFADSC